MLSKAGVPQVVREAVAKLLDLEFDLAKDGAPGIVALILLASAFVGTYRSIYSSPIVSLRNPCPTIPLPPPRCR